MAERAGDVIPKEQALALLEAQIETTRRETRGGETGIPAGTIVLTMEGEMPVEHILPGDRIITRDQGAVCVDGIDATTGAMEMIAFAAGSLGHRRPDTDTLLPAGQKILIRDWRAKALYGQGSAMIEAARLIDGQFVRSMGTQTVKIHHLRFATSHVVYAGGLELGVEPS